MRHATVQRRLAWWLHQLGLESLRITLTTTPGLHSNRAHCANWEPEYHQGEIYVDRERVADRNELDAILAHELAHTFSWRTVAAAENIIKAGDKAKRAERMETLRLAYEEDTTLLETLLMTAVLGRRGRVKRAA